MSEPTPKDPSRGPTNLRIKFRSASLDQFIERYAVDVSRGGIFIRTREPLPVDTRLRAGVSAAGFDAAFGRRRDRGLDPRARSDARERHAGHGRAVRQADAGDPADAGEDPRREDPPRAGRRGGGRAAQRGRDGRAPPVGRLRQPRRQRARGPRGDPPAPDGRGPHGSGVDADLRAPSPRDHAGNPQDQLSRVALGRAQCACRPPAQSGPFTRARSTTTRPVPVPSALFEPPTAADIDKALEVLQEAPGPAPAARQSPTVPRYVADDASNEPTRVADVVDELVGGSAGPRGTMPAPMTDRLSAGAAGEPRRHGRVPGGIRTVGGAARRAPRGRGRRRGAGRPRGAGGGGGAGAARPEQAIPGRFARLSHAEPPAARPHHRARRGGRPRGGGRRGRQAAPQGSLLPNGCRANGCRAERGVTGAHPGPAHRCASAGRDRSDDGARRGGGCGRRRRRSRDAAAARRLQKSRLPTTQSPKRPPKKRKRLQPTEKNVGARGRAGERRAPQQAPPRPPQGRSRAAPRPPQPQPRARRPTSRWQRNPPPKSRPPSSWRRRKPPRGRPATNRPAAAPAPAAPILKVTSSPPGAAVLIDGRELGNTPFVSKEVDPSSPHTITIKKDGYEPSERMVSGLDWSRPHGNSPQTLKVNAKLRRTAAAAPAATPAPAKENAEPEDTGGPYIKEIKPDSP